MQDQNFINEPEVQKWIDQGRDKEHIYAVRNFLTGQGAVMIKRLIADKQKEWCLKKPNIEVSTVIGYEAGQKSERESIKNEIERRISVAESLDYSDEKDVLQDLLTYFNKK
jgi:hypothetical protein